MIALAAAVAALAVWLLIPHPTARIAALSGPPSGLRRRWRGRPRLPGRNRTEANQGQVPDALDFLAVCISAGLPMSRALATVVEVSPTPTRDLLADVAGQLALGRAGPLAWEGLRDLEVWGQVAADIARSERSGTALAAVLKVHADEIRQEIREAAIERARTVGVKSAVPLMACFLPAIVLVGVVPIIAGLLQNFLG